jgi:hypothetical protein
LAGFGLGVLVADGPACGEDLTCILEDVAVAVSAASAGAVVGALLAGRAAGGSPSWWGALAGSVAGAAAGLGVVKLLDEGGVKNEVAGVIAFSVSQGAFTALGGWLAGR